MTKIYTNINDLKIDLQLFVNMQTNGAYTLDLFPALAKQRYPWIVDNWNKLYDNFKTYANGDQDLELALEDFDSSVRGYKLSVSNNPLNALENPEKLDLYSPFLALIDIQGISVTAPEINLINNELQRVSNLNIDDFKSMLKYINQYIAIKSSSIGLYDEDGFNAMGLPSVERKKAATVSDMSEMDNMIEAKKYIESIILSMKTTIDKPPDLLSISNQNIAGGSVAVSTAYRSYISVPFSISLEHMATVYMGDKSKWYELVTVNNLQPPYVDEVGQKFLLVAPGANNNITISSDYKNNLHIGAEIEIGSVTIKHEKRSVNKIAHNNNNTMVLYLSGKSDLSKLQTIDGAYVRVYSPHTVNGGKFIKIPVDIASSVPNSLTPSNDDLRKLDSALLNFGIDIAQDNNGDIAIAPNGNFAMAYGLNNVTQTIRNIIKTTKNELPFHPNYGIDSNLGNKMFGPGDTSTILADMIKSAVLRDQRFVSVDVKNITFSGTSVSMLLLVKIQGSTQIIPLSFVG